MNRIQFISPAARGCGSHPQMPWIGIGNDEPQMTRISQNRRGLPRYRRGAGASRNGKNHTRLRMTRAAKILSNWPHKKLLIANKSLDFSGLSRKKIEHLQIVDFSQVITIFHIISRFFTLFFSQKRLVFRRLGVLPGYKRLEAKQECVPECFSQRKRRAQRADACGETPQAIRETRVLPMNGSGRVLLVCRSNGCTPERRGESEKDDNGA